MGMSIFLAGYPCWRRTGRRPMTGRWADHNTGDSLCPDTRSRRRAKEVSTYRTDAFFAATPPLEAMRMISSGAAVPQER